MVKLGVFGLGQRADEASAAPVRRGPPGKRLYAIGDVHGRLDLLTELLDTIADHHEARPKKVATIVLLGDLIDRGPDSCGVVELARAGAWRGIRLVTLCGNHEELLLRTMAGDGSALGVWFGVGGIDCVRSYGLEPGFLFGRAADEVAMRLQQAVPPAHLSFLKGLPDSARFGDYFLAHAGVRPGLALEDQSSADLRWIRTAFLNNAQDHGVVVIHGHSEQPGVDARSNRIGIDTGAYRTGVLTAIWVEDDTHGFLQAVGDPTS